MGFGYAQSVFVFLFFFCFSIFQSRNKSHLCLAQKCYECFTRFSFPIYRLMAYAAIRSNETIAL
jgi:hypothetical protein